MNLLGWIHGTYVFGRRVRRLCGHLVDLIPSHATVLDVGCGDGALASLLMQQRPDITLQGIDTLVRPDAKIPVKVFDGSTIPYDNASIDVVMFVDSLHHTQDIITLLREAVRVGRQSLLIKDHLLDGAFAAVTLRFMDWVGNARHGVALPYNYWPEQKWRAAFEEFGLTVRVWKTALGLYPWPANRVFERSLNFITRLDLP